MGFNNFGTFGKINKNCNRKCNNNNNHLLYYNNIVITHI